MEKETLETPIATFAVNVYKRVSHGHDNVLFSPYGIYAALLLADLGAKGLTEKELRAVLGLGELSKYELHGLYRDLRNSLKKDKIETVDLNVASRLFLKSGLDVDDNYVKESKSYYDNELGFLNPDEGTEALIRTVNKWVDGETKGNIRDLVSSDDLGHLPLMILVNAVHFKAAWLDPFSSVKTTSVDFHIGKHRKKPVDMMHSLRSARYFTDDNLDCTAIELPFLKRRMRMIFIRPNQRNGLRELETVLMTGNAFRLLLIGMGKATYTSVSLSVPKFKMEDSCNFAKILPALGIRAMFKEGSSDFTGIIPTKPAIHVPDFIHKASLEIDESEQDGSTNEDKPPAGDVKPEAEQFVLDRPFMFIVLDLKSGAILFMGRYTQPPTEGQRMCVIA